MTWLAGLKRRAVRRLAAALAAGAAARPGVLADLGAQAVIEPEGAVENLAGRRDAVRIGAHTHVRGRLLTYAHGGSVRLGDWCYVGVRSELWSAASIAVGDRVLIAHDVNIVDNTAHPRDPAERHAHFRRIVTAGHPTAAADLPGIAAAPIVIEDDVWISFGVTVLRGVRIGARSIVAAGSVVTRDVPPDTLYRCAVTPVMTPLARGLA